MGLFVQAQAGDADALSALVRQHIPLVTALSRRFSFCEDAFQQGCLGLVQAIRRFQEGAGYQFSTYAVPVILGEMRRAFSHTLGWRARAALRRARAYQEEILHRTGQAPTIRDTAAFAGIRPEELTLLMERDQPPLYDETGELLASLPDPRGENWLLRLCIRDILDRLPRGDQWLILQRFARGRSQMEIARQLGVSQSRVSRREKSARLHFCREWEGKDQE